MDLTLHCFYEPSALDRALAEFVSDRLRSALAARGQASLVVSGGRTPQGFFRLLSKKELDWSRVLITLADDRWVDEKSPYSNAQTVRQGLMINEASRARFIPLYRPAPTPAETAVLASQDLAALPPTIDVVVLGMGEDGHTASIFSESPDYQAALRNATRQSCIAVTGKAPVSARVTLTAARLMACDCLAVHITGEAKWRTLGQVASKPDDELPLSFVLNSSICKYKHVFWTP